MGTLIGAVMGMRPFAVDGAALRALVSDRTVMVTGASRGVGRAIALHCAAAGAHGVVDRMAASQWRRAGGGR